MCALIDTQSVKVWWRYNTSDENIRQFIAKKNNNKRHAITCSHIWDFDTLVLIRYTISESLVEIQQFWQFFVDFLGFIKEYFRPLHKLEAFHKLQAKDDRSLKTNDGRQTTERIENSRITDWQTFLKIVWNVLIIYGSFSSRTLFWKWKKIVYIGLLKVNENYCDWFG